MTTDIRAIDCLLIAKLFRFHLIDWTNMFLTFDIYYENMYFLGANRTLPTGFAILSSTVLKLGDLEVCFVATLKIYDCLSIQIGTYSHFNHTKINVHFSDLCRLATFYTQSCCLVARHTKLALRYFLA